jgi:hypothetical protein
MSNVVVDLAVQENGNADCPQTVSGKLKVFVDVDSLETSVHPLNGFDADADVEDAVDDDAVDAYAYLHGC